MLVAAVADQEPLLVLVELVAAVTAQTLHLLRQHPVMTILVAAVDQAAVEPLFLVQAVDQVLSSSQSQRITLLASQKV
jgi:hypothetical protein